MPIYNNLIEPHHSKIAEEAYMIKYFRVAYGVFPLPCFYLTSQPIQSKYCLKGLLMKNTGSMNCEALLATPVFWLHNLHSASKTYKTNLRHSQVRLLFETGLWLVTGRVDVVYDFWLGILHSRMSNLRYTSFMFGKICKNWKNSKSTASCGFMCIRYISFSVLITLLLTTVLPSICVDSA